MDDVNSLWKVTATKGVDSPRLTEDLTCDVVIVGGGYTGLRAALALAEHGTDVVVLEAHEVGWGASGRNGGQVNPMLPAHYPKDLIASVGGTYFERMTSAALSSADALFDLVKKYDIDCDARQKGWIRADHSAAARKTARTAARMWNEYGAGYEFLDGDDVARLSGSIRYQSAIMSPKGGAVQPLSLARGLAKAARDSGARIFGKAQVSTAERKDGMWCVHVSDRVVRAPVLIAATNGYSDNLVPGLKRSVLPLYSIQIATGPLSEDEIGAILPHGHTIADTRRLITYARREPGNQFAFGGIGYHKLFGGQGGFDWILKDAPRIFPSLHRAKFTYRWGGSIALTPDRVPHLHEPQPGLLAGLGYNGRGVAMSLVMGSVLAQRALGADPESLTFPISKIRPFAFRNTQVFGSGIAMHVLRWRDVAEAG